MTIVPSATKASLQQVIAEGSRHYRGCEWSLAADLYREVISTGSIEQGRAESARIIGLLAECEFRIAFQSHSRDEFKEKMKEAAIEYRKAASGFKDAGLTFFSNQMKARAYFADFWMADDPEDRRLNIEKSITLIENSGALDDTNVSLGICASLEKDLLTYIVEVAPLALSQDVLKTRLRKAAELAVNTIKEFETLEDDLGLLESLHMAILFPGYSWQTLDPSELDALVEKAKDWNRQIAQVSSRMGTGYSECLAKEAAGWVAEREPEGKYGKALAFLEEAMPLAQKLGDAYLQGRILAYAAYIADVLGIGEEDVEQRRAALEKGLEYAAASIESLEIILHGDRLDSAYWWLAECHVELANHVETDLEKKKNHLKEAIETGRKGAQLRKHTWSEGSCYTLGKALYSLATLESDNTESTRLLQESLDVREGTTQRYEAVNPRSWGAGMAHSGLALVKAEFARREHDPKRKLELLQRAETEMRRGIELCSRTVPNPGFVRVLARTTEYYGDILAQLFQLTGEVDRAHQAVETYSDTISYLKRAEQLGSMPSVLWKIARVQDRLADFQSASEEFQKAAEAYRNAASKLLRLRDVFTDFSSYMEAWSHIENARLDHGEDQYSRAATSYDKAANLLRASGSWSYLSSHYTACSHLELGEERSRFGENEKAVTLFQTASKEFLQALSEIESRVRDKSESRQKGEWDDWRRIAEERESYCQGRILLEEAKILDRRGEEGASARKYHAASKIFQSIATQEMSEHDRRELEGLICFSEAWRLMMEAEAEATPGLYAEAAENFSKAKTFAARGKFRLLAEANAAICRALELGMGFRLSKETKLYVEIKKQLETATDYYHDAGLTAAAGWALATQKLFDALLYTINAETATEATTKAESYHLAEKHFEHAARLYGKSGYLSKQERTLRQLQRVHDEKELILTPMEALEENPAFSNATAAPVSLTRDQALGLERLETANIVGSLIVHENQPQFGTRFEYELELSNIGKTTAILLTADELAPEGLELDRGNQKLRIRNSHLDLRGKRLEYLDTEEVRVTLRAARKGTHELKPRIIYMDAQGNRETFRFESQQIKVIELGIRRWIKGSSG